MNTNHSELEVPDTPSYIISTRWALEGVLLTVVGAIGVVGNMVSLCVIITTNLKLKKFFIRLIAMLCVFDSLCIIFNICIFSGPLLNETYRHQIFPHLVPILLPLAQISLTSSVYTIVTVAIERFITVQKPRFEFSSLTSWVLCFLIILFSTLVNINKFFEYETKTITATMASQLHVTGAEHIGVDTATGENIWQWSLVQPTQLRMDRMYAKISNLSSIFLSLIPFLFLILINLFIYKTIKKKTPQLSQSSRRDKREVYVATILISIIMIYAFCHTITTFISILELISVILGGEMVWGPKMNILVSISHVLITTNCSGNFAIYCWKDNQFRRRFLSLVSCTLLEREKESQSTNLSSANQPDAVQPIPTTVQTLTKQGILGRLYQNSEINHV